MQYLVFEPGEKRTSQIQECSSPPVVGTNVPYGCRVYPWTKFPPQDRSTDKVSQNPRDYIEFMGGLRCAPEKR